MRNLTLGSLFDGSGGFPLAGLLAGIVPVWSSEIEPFAIRVTEKRLPQVQHFGNISGLHGAKLPPVDIITFGSPCQDMSIAGKRTGLNGSRSSLSGCHKEVIPMRYEIKGTPFPVVICQLEDGEQMVTERGSMVWMSPNMEMQTHGGGLGRMFSKMFSGESMFQNIYTAHGAGMIAFGSSFPGQIKEIAITPGHDMILQKSAFLAAVPGVELSIHFNQRLGAGLFGGEGLIMQRLSGSGMAFAEIDGTLVEYDLQPGQQIVVDTGNVAGFTAGVQMEIRQVPGMKNSCWNTRHWQSATAHIRSVSACRKLMAGNWMWTGSQMYRKSVDTV